MWPHYVYIHRKPNGEPFYIGKGKIRRFSYERAYAKDHRNIMWRRIVSKYGLIVEIVASCKTDKAAQELERNLIARIGRRDLGLGPLVNFTDGGDGHAGIIASNDLRRKRSKNASGPRSGAWIKSIRIARKNGGNGGVVKKGDKLPDKWVASLAAAKIGNKNPNYGKATSVSRRVKNIKTGQVYDSISRAASAEGLNAKTLYQYLDGSRLNKTSLVKL